ncbi:Acetyltransferase (GNAT) family protein [compost metagenome]
MLRAYTAAVLATEGIILELLFLNTLPDKEEYYELYQSTGWDPEGRWTSTLLQNSLINSWYIVSVIKDGRLAAAGRIISDGVIQCIICDVIVSPECQGLGIGTMVMDRLIGHCKTEGICWIQLSAASGKAAFYERFGFVPRAADAPGMSLLL